MAIAQASRKRKRKKKKKKHHAPVATPPASTPSTPASPPPADLPRYMHVTGWDDGPGDGLVRPVYEWVGSPPTDTPPPRPLPRPQDPPAPKAAQAFGVYSGPFGRVQAKRLLDSNLFWHPSATSLRTLHGAPGRRRVLVSHSRSGPDQRQTVNLAHGTWTLYCSLLDHKAQGMQATLKVD